MNFSTAFDRLNHDQLVKKPRTLGIKGRRAEWFSSYPKQRKQLVKITSTKYKTITTTKCGLMA